MKLLGMVYLPIVHFCAGLALLPLAAINSAVATGKYEIGVYYFPGWQNDAVGSVDARPWDKIKSFPAREPLLGWYGEGEVSVAETQLMWMHKYGIDFVVYDWYWMPNDRPALDQAIRAYLKARNNNDVKFAILWANHSDVPQNLQQFVSMVRYWCDSYLSHKQFLRIDGRPVVFVFSLDRLRANASRFGKSLADLLAVAQQVARAQGLPDIYFVADIEFEAPGVGNFAQQVGFSAQSAYNYHSGHGETRVSHSYTELDVDYRDHWNWVVRDSPLPYLVPMTAGWNRKPWGGSPDAQHDQSMSTPASFESHLLAARSFMDEHQQTLKTGVICCWNEFGEGSYVEPTKSVGFQYLERIARVFGSTATR